MNRERDAREIMRYGHEYERRRWLRQHGCREGYVYFIEAVGSETVKIGTALDPVGRMYSLQCGCPLRLRMVLVVAGGKGRETGYHRMWDKHRARGEWFHINQGLVEYVRSKTSIYPFWGAVDEARAARGVVEPDAAIVCLADVEPEGVPLV